MNQERKEERKQNSIEFWKRVLFHNLSMKLLSVVGAVLVWLLIMNIDDPYKTKTFLVQVETINEDALHSVHKVYEIVEGNTASVTVRGKRSVVDNLGTDDISATADLSELSSVNAVAIKVRLKRNVSSDIVLTCNQVLKVSLEDMEKKQVKLTIETEGTPAEGYSVGECTTRPGVIEVTGGSSVIDRIATVRVTINVNGASQDITKTVEPVAYDKRGNRVFSSTLSFSEKIIRVRAKLLQNKTIPVKIKVSGEPAEGYEFVEAVCLPETIEIAGSEKKLANVSQLVIPIDITGRTDASGDLEQEITVEDYLDEDVIVLEDYQKLTVTLSIEKLIRKKIQLQTTKVQISNVDEDYMATVYGNVGTLELTLEGRESVIEELSDTDLSAYVDCSGLENGIYSLPVQIALGEKCRLVKSAKISVLISKRSEDSTPVETPEPSATPIPEMETVPPEEEPEEEEE